MLETLYRTETPETSVWDGEYYTLFLSRPTNRSGYILTEQHGWWDDERKKPVNNTITLSPEEGFATVEEGLAEYNKQKFHRARGGFIHSFSPDFFGEKPHNYERIDVNEARP